MQTDFFILFCKHPDLNIVNNQFTDLLTAVLVKQTGKCPDPEIFLKRLQDTKQCMTVPPGDIRLR